MTAHLEPKPLQRRLMALAAVGACASLGALGGAEATSTPPAGGPKAGSVRSQAVASPPSATEPAKQEAKLLPSPSRSEAEKRFLARMDALIAPAVGLAAGADDLRRLKEAVAAASSTDPAKAKAVGEQIADPVLRKLARWHRLRAGYGEAADYIDFMNASPNWPDRTLLRQRLEDALFTQGGSAKTIRAVFDADAPSTGVGLAALASAHLAEGNTARARELAARAWRELRIPVTLETGFLQRFGAMLQASDHKWRLDRLLTDEIRSAEARNERAAVVRRLIPLLSDSERRKAEARLAVFLRQANAQKLMDALPVESSVDWGLAYHRVQLLRRGGKHTEAWKTLLSAPVDPRAVVNLDEWWEERRINAQNALNAGNAKLAFDLVRDAGPLTVNPQKDQAFMAGWIALRHLNDPATAIRHFDTMRKAADGPLSRAKSAYWAGRAREAAGDSKAARALYVESSRNIDTFHGLLSAARLDPGRREIEIAMPALPTAAEAESFNASEVVRAAVAARAAGLDPAIWRVFISHLARSVFTDEAGAAMVAHLAEALGDTQQSLRVGKTGVGRGHNLLIYAYPIHRLPGYAPLRNPVETALLLAIARQESEFNPQTVSHAGARGLLQVMPITARHVCKDYTIKCDIPRLLTDTAYNTRIASAYIADRSDDFGGSYVLTLTGYNAGPGRTRQWLRELGDPRAPKADVIDWIERIPFDETRGYVGKVLSNLQVYRARLGQSRSALRITEDLARDRKGASQPGAGRQSEAAAGQTAR